MHVRRALLLFAIVLGLAALVASVSGPRQEEERTATTPPPAAGRAPTATLRPARRGTARIVFPAGHRATRQLDAGRPAVLLVETRTAGQAEIPGLGLSAPAEPRTPARFEILSGKMGRYEIRFAPATNAEVVLAGTLVVRRPRPR